MARRQRRFWRVPFSGSGLIVLYRVFFDGTGRYSGSQFRIFHSLSNDIAFDEEYALIEDQPPFSVRFYQQGNEFEFCGAGALCLAYYLKQQGQLTEDLVIKHTSFPFELTLIPEEQTPAVMLPKLAAAETIDIEGFRSVYYFKPQDVAVFWVDNLDQVQDFQFDAAQTAVACNTAIVVYIEELLNAVYFRYFTRFNNKGEDQATGSFFRYLAALPLDHNIWYEVNQESEQGAAMQCSLESDRIVYTGKVEKLAE